MKTIIWNFPGQHYSVKVVDDNNVNTRGSKEFLYYNDARIYANSIGLIIEDKLG